VNEALQNKERSGMLNYASAALQRNGPRGCSVFHAECACGTTL